MKHKFLCLSLLFLLSSCHEERLYPIDYEKEHPEVLFDVNAQDARKVYEERKDHRFDASFSNQTANYSAKDEEGALMEYLIPLLDKEPMTQYDASIFDEMEYYYCFLIFYSKGSAKTPNCGYTFYLHQEHNCMEVIFFFHVYPQVDVEKIKYFSLSETEGTYIKGWIDEKLSEAPNIEISK